MGGAARAAIGHRSAQPYGLQQHVQRPPAWVGLDRDVHDPRGLCGGADPD